MKPCCLNVYFLIGFFLIEVHINSQSENGFLKATSPFLSHTNQCPETGSLSVKKFPPNIITTLPILNIASKYSFSGVLLSHSFMYFLFFAVPNPLVPLSAFIPYGGSVKTRSTLPSGIFFISSKQSPCISLIISFYFSP